MHQTWLHVPAALIASGIPRKNVLTNRRRRYAGQSHIKYVSLALSGVRALMVFAGVVLMRLIFGGIVLIVVTAVLALVACGLKVTGNATPEWATTVVGLVLVLVTQMLGIFAVLLVLVGLVRGGIPRNASKAYLDCIGSVEAT